MAPKAPIGALTVRERFPNPLFSARPKGADHQWGKDPPKEVVG